MNIPGIKALGAIAVAALAFRTLRASVLLQQAYAEIVPMEKEDQRLIFAAIGGVAAVAFVLFGTPDSEHFIALCVVAATLLVADDISILSRPAAQIIAFVTLLLAVLLAVFHLPVSIKGYGGIVSVPFCIAYGLLLRYGFRQVGHDSPDP